MTNGGRRRREREKVRGEQKPQREKKLPTVSGNETKSQTEGDTTKNRNFSVVESETRVWTVNQNSRSTRDVYELSTVCLVDTQIVC